MTDWKLADGTGRRIVDLLRLAGDAPTANFNLLGVVLTGRAMAGFIRDALGIEDAADAGRAEAILASRLAEQVDLPPALARGIDGATIDRDDLDLARACGLDPLRLLSGGADGIARAERDGASHRAIPRWRDRRLDRVEMAFTLRRGVVWRGGKLIAQKAGIPATMAAALVGRPLSEVVGHHWGGWARLVATGATVGAGEELTIATERAGGVALATA